MLPLCKTGLLGDPTSTATGNACAVVGGAGAAGVSDTVALNLEVNTSALNLHEPHPPPTASPHSNHTPLRPRDFLDVVDSAATPPDWGAVPTRPRMFPHKLY